MKIIKRNGVEETFLKDKIANAILKANRSVNDNHKCPIGSIYKIASIIQCRCEVQGHTVTVEEVQDMVENELLCRGYFVLAKNYIKYRYKRQLSRKTNSTDAQILSLLECNNEEIIQENSNKNPMIASTQRDYMAGEVSKDISRRYLIPDDIMDAHDKGLIHIHDLDYYAMRVHNCDLVNLEDMLQNGTVISGTKIDKPKSFSTACNIATQCVAQISSSQLGGQSISLSHLAPFVDISRQKFRKIVREELTSQNLPCTDEIVNNIAETRVLEEINRGVQMIQYQVITLMTTNGQAPFITVFMYINELPEGQTRDDLVLIIKETLRQRILGVKNEKGVYITPAFPKLIYVLQEDNITPGSKYYDVTELAAKCTAKRMAPDYISEKVMKQLKVDKTGEGVCYTCMGCRSFLTPDRTTENVAKAMNYDSTKGKYYGRFNQGVVTINLPDVALSSNGNEEKFWEILDERLDLCYRALMCKHKRLLGTKSDIAPILWQHGALARLDKGETIDKLLYGGYSTISLGYAGIYETTLFMTGKSHTDPEVGTPFATKVMQYLNDACSRWKAETNIDFSLYGTPLESTTYKFAKCLENRFGVHKGITDKNYITNSYHVVVTEEINAFEKLSFESKLQELSPGGAISYVEVPNMQNNIDAVIAIIRHIYDTILYAEINTKSDYCHVCEFDGEIQIIEEDHKLIWECPNCKNRDQSKMNVSRRTCGYIGSHFWNQGRTQEIKDRVLHVALSKI